MGGWEEEDGGERSKWEEEEMDKGKEEEAEEEKGKKTQNSPRCLWSFDWECWLVYCFLSGQRVVGKSVNLLPSLELKALRVCPC